MPGLFPYSLTRREVDSKSALFSYNESSVIVKDQNVYNKRKSYRLIPREVDSKSAPIRRFRGLRYWFRLQIFDDLKVHVVRIWQHVLDFEIKPRGIWRHVGDFEINHVAFRPRAFLTKWLIMRQNHVVYNRVLDFEIKPHGFSGHVLEFEIKPCGTHVLDYQK